MDGEAVMVVLVVVEPGPQKDAAKHWHPTETGLRQHRFPDPLGQPTYEPQPIHADQDVQVVPSPSPVVVDGEAVAE